MTAAGPLIAYLFGGGGVLAALGVGMRISYQLGALVKELTSFVEQAGRIHDDQEHRIRALEIRNWL